MMTCQISRHLLAGFVTILLTASSFTAQAAISCTSIHGSATKEIDISELVSNPMLWKNYRSTTQLKQQIKTDFRRQADGVNYWEFYSESAKELKVNFPQMFGKIIDEDLISLVAYSFDHFRPMNESLRTRNPILLSEYKNLIKGAVSALNQLPIYKGTVTRVVNLTAEQQLSYSQKINSVVREDAFVSTSQQTVDEWNQAGNKSNTIFIIKSKNGRDVSKVLHKHGGDLIKEVLFIPGTNFFVKSITSRTSEAIDNSLNQLFIFLEEI